jgi:hypothetical protein
LVAAVRGHVGTLVFGLAHVYTWHEIDSGDGGENSTLGLTVADLVRYAQTGDTADWGGPEGAHDATLVVCGALFVTPAGDDTASELWRDADARTPIGLVVVAAMARATLDGSPPVGHVDGLAVPECAALASVSYRLVADLCARGEIAIEGRVIPLAEARRWLRARGVPGV